MTHYVHVSVVSRLAADGHSVGAIKIPYAVFEQLRMRGYGSFRLFDAPNTSPEVAHVQSVLFYFDPIKREIRGNCQISDIALTFLANPKSALDALTDNLFMLDSIAPKSIFSIYKALSQYLCVQ